MEVKKGLVVRSIAGHDKGQFKVIINESNGYVFLCDGKSHPLTKLKKKKVIHLRFTNTVLEEKTLDTDKSIRLALKPFSESVKNNSFKISECK